LPYQPLDELAGVLSAADLHAVVMGREFVGVVHPCKIYNVLAVSSPFLYVGPKESHIADIARSREVDESVYMAGHGESEFVAQQIVCSLERRPHKNLRVENPEWASDFSREALLPTMIDILERPSVTPTVRAAAISEPSV
jgi:hypothetical protein